MLPLTPKRILAVIALTLSVYVLSAPASAIDGRNAVNQCVNLTASGARCSWAVNSKGEVDVCTKSGCVTCPSATGTCVKARTGVPTKPFDRIGVAVRQRR
jgi:hypothetical protein